MDENIRKELDILIGIRQKARDLKQYELADMLRDYLEQYWGVEITDTENAVCFAFKK